MPENPFPGVVGFATPIFTQELTEHRDGPLLNGVSASLHERIEAGYACGHCLALFIFYMATCPVCGNVRDLSRDIQGSPPPLWQQHLDEREHGYEKTEAGSIDDF